MPPDINPRSTPPSEARVHHLPYSIYLTTHLQSMGHKLSSLWTRIQGKQQVCKLCDRIFDQCAEGGLLTLDKLHLATLLVYDAINKHFPNPHKDAPSIEKIGEELKALQREKLEKIDKDNFQKLILKWLHKDLHIFLVNKILVALVAAPLVANITKNAGKRVPRIGQAVEKIPTAVLVPSYAVGFVLLQDVHV